MKLEVQYNDVYGNLIEKKFSMPDDYNHLEVSGGKDVIYLQVHFFVISKDGNRMSMYLPSLKENEEYEINFERDKGFKYSKRYDLNIKKINEKVNKELPF